MLKSFVVAVVVLASSAAFAQSMVTDPGPGFSLGSVGSVGDGGNPASNGINTGGLGTNSSPSTSSNNLPPTAMESSDPSKSTNCYIYQQRMQAEAQREMQQQLAVGTPSQTMNDMGVNDIMNKKVDVLGISSLLGGSLDFSNLFSQLMSKATSYAQNAMTSTLSRYGMSPASLGASNYGNITPSVAVNQTTQAISQAVPAPSQTTTQTAISAIKSLW